MMVHGIAPLLVAAAAGYWVVTQAEHQKGGVRTLGQYLGVAVILVSVLGVACKLYAITTGQGMGDQGFCPISAGPRTAP